ncbi:MAG: hypothetical protein Q9225_007511 [Loekoesia sp. 1 TL-2023]
MSNIDESPRSILYQTEDKTTTLVDIPSSISEAQGTPDNPCMDMLWSPPPLEKPYPSIEPNSHKAKQKVQASLHLGDLIQSTFPQDLLVQGLADIRAACAGRFCAKRKFANQQPASKVQDQIKSGTPQPGEGIMEETVTVACHADRGFVIGPVFQPRKPLFLPSSATSDGYEAVRMTDVVSRVVSNPFVQPTQLLVLDTAQKYKIPPLSTFMLSKVGQQEASLFSSAAYKLLPEPSISAAPGQFDFILLDPPWENRSVRRSKNYETQRKANDDPMDVLQEMLEKHIAPNGLVACWITNKKRVRDAALQVFQAWGVELVEEWAWLKATVHGDPICPIDGIMRRPYEILLIGKSISPAIDSYEDLASEKPTEKRLIVGVPDIHSRKPCLKALIEPIMANKSDYRALEVFARNLTAGWWSWGDEVLKYNWEGYWTKAEPLNIT